jgi:hypothetical protein
MRGARYHEAGHTVAAHHNGYTINSITATADEWRTYWSRRPYGGPVDAWRDACVTLAGQLADQVVHWGEMRPEPWEEFWKTRRRSASLWRMETKTCEATTSISWST